MSQPELLWPHEQKTLVGKGRSREPRAEGAEVPGVQGVVLGQGAVEAVR